MTWTDDRIATLKHCWKDGFSASQVAQRLGGVTRNAVIGKVHRLGLAGRTNSSRGRPSRRSRSYSQAARKPTPSRCPTRVWRIRQSPAPATTERPPVLPELGPAPQIPVTVQTLTPRTCRWPEGNPKSPDFHFCGRVKTNPTIPYCDHHAAIAFR
jgi:GcrA cell cycle regulator